MPVAKPFTLIRNRMNCGFTLIELIVTITIAGILLAVGVPAMQDMIIEINVSGNVNQFIAAATFARTEAIKRGRQVKICRSVNAESGANKCHTKMSGDNGSNDWGAGWIVIVPSENNLVLLRQRAFSAKYYAEATRRDIIYNGLGVPAGAFSGANLRFTYEGNLDTRRIVCITKSGRIRVALGAVDC